MRENRDRNELRLLEELMKDKEAIFRQEIDTLRASVDELESQLHREKKYVTAFLSSYCSTIPQQWRPNLKNFPL